MAETFADLLDSLDLTCAEAAEASELGLSTIYALQSGEYGRSRRATLRALEQGLGVDRKRIQAALGESRKRALEQEAARERRASR